MAFLRPQSDSVGWKLLFFHYWILTRLIKERKLQMCNLDYVVILINQGQIHINWYYFPNSEGVLWILHTCNGLILPICGWEAQMDAQLFSCMLILLHPTQNHSTTLNISKETYISPLCTVSVTNLKILQRWIWLGLYLDIWSAALTRGVWKGTDCRERQVGVQWETRSCEVWGSALPTDDQRQP